MPDATLLDIIQFALALKMSLKAIRLFDATEKVRILYFLNCVITYYILASA